VRHALALFVLVACARSTPSEHELVSAAQDETRVFFALGEGGDCGKLAPKLQRPNECEDLVRQFRETRTHLTKIEGAKLDGRDKQTVLVSVEASAPERVHHWIVRAKWTPEGWRFAL
jgi:hypothetical protein